MKNEWIRIIKDKADEVRNLYSYPNEPIRDNIFKILRKEGVVVLFPLDEEKDLDGFHVNRVMEGEIVPFVYINTFNYWDKCIFCAAHELGHIKEIEKYIKEEFPDVKIDDNECDEVMNRFAAELLMPEDSFRNSVSRYFNDNKLNVKSITDQDIVKLAIELMDFYFVPYKAVIKRLYEISFLSEKGRNHFIEYNAAVIESYIAEGNYIRPRQKNIIKQIDKLEEIISRTQNKSSLSKEKVKKICNDFDITISEQVEEYLEQSAENKLTAELYNAGGVK